VYVLSDCHVLLLLHLDRSSELEREVQELRAQLSRTSVLSEVDDLRRTLELKDRERTQLCNQVEVRVYVRARRYVGVCYACLPE
jgi:hypothetical protein